ncbi:hypothetical protein [Wolbachia endosymbiont of Chironomus riparius]|uniref:hypothetical protein n=1 Tax=Wolbachia endosymbiont of Chironomus riparius TaxID=2883238 RepID=UPI0020A186AC|nr:hypothetical protein [Wolbachia endosymbiont of Chironomus riparius]
MLKTTFSKKHSERTGFSKEIKRLNNHNIRRIICISTSLTALLCRISLQFCCDFIDKNESTIFSIWNTATVIKLPMQILSICNTMCVLQSLIEEQKNLEEVVKIIGKSAFLVSDIISILNKLKIIHFFFENNGISHINFASTFLFLFVSEPISYYYSYKKYQESKNRESKNTDEYIKCRKSFIINNVVLALGLLNFLFKRIDISTIPIELGSGIVYNFNVSVTISMIYTAIFVILSVDRLLNQTNISEPSSDVHDNNINGIQANGTYVDVTQ